MQKYVAIIGDIVQSKKIQKRAEVQENLKQVLNTINTIYHEDIAANFIITLGDEFQGLLNDGLYVLEIIRLIQRQLYPTEVRFGIGYGEITTQISREAAIGADGPAYYAARNMINDLRIQEKKYKRQASDVLVNVYEDDNILVDQINTLFRINNIIKNEWSDEQRITIMDMIHYGESQESCARRLGTTQSTVARRLSSGKYIIYMDVENVIDKSLKEITK
ncbi:SatD family protein [Butyrivibrio sp. AC2005]|uniref:SatD family protein n=1 Tax=Butyrivibrio sp. AC2005 TaxID=1280672 RepID=UPI0004191C6B|nr:SatD family protein [Butyrivibrio sp. AC2005]